MLGLGLALWLVSGGGAWAEATISVNGDSSNNVLVPPNTSVTMEIQVTDCDPASSYTQYWYFDDGTTDSQTGTDSPCTSPYNVTHTYTTPGNYRVYYVNGNTNRRIQWDQVIVRVRAGAGGLADFQIDHDGAGINCLAEPITFTALNNGGNVMQNYTGTMSLSTSSGNGDWAVNTGAGTLDNGMADDGAASYTFDANDDGQVILDLSDTHAETLTITASDAGVSSTSASITFRPFGFVVTPDPVGTRVAGMDFTLTLTAAGQTPSSPDCGVIEEYDGDKTVKFWSTYVDPGSGSNQVSVDGNPIATSEASATDQTVTFTDGVADVTANYFDAGTIQIHAKDDTGIGEPPSGSGDEVIGGVAPFVVRPFGFDVDFSGDRAANPDCASQVSCAADAGGDVFATAGANFDATVTAVVWQAADDGDSNGVPDTGADLTDNAATPNFGQESTPDTVTVAQTLAAPAGGDPSTLTGGAGIGGFAGGAATTTLSWDDVGIIDLNATISDNDYQGGGEDVTGTAANVGRFVPDRLQVTDNAPAFAEACGTAFTYMDQTFTFDTAAGEEPRITVTGLSIAGDATDNYDPAGAFWKLSTTLANRGYSDNVGGTATLDAQTVGSVSQSNATDFDAQATYVVTGDLFAYQRPTSPSAPFDADVDADLPAGDLTDSDGVCHDPDDDGACDAYTISGIQGTELRFGRLRIDNAHGSELVDLPMPVSVQHYQDATSGFVTNTADTCTSLSDSPAGPPQWGDFELTNYQGNLASGDTAPSGSGLTNGAGTLTLSAPGNGNDGSVQVVPHLETAGSAQPWLQFDWDGDGNHDNNPSARATFGIFDNEDEWIHQREVY